MANNGSEQELDVTAAKDPTNLPVDGVFRDPVFRSVAAPTLFRTVVSTISEGLVVADQSGRLVFFNPAAEQMLGLGAVDVGSSQWSAIYNVFLPDGEPCPEHELPLVRALNGEAVNDAHILICQPGKATQNLHCNGQPLFNDDGEKCGAALVMRDVTTEVQARTELENAVTALKRSNRDLEQFASVAAHDLQEPLRSVSNYLELLLNLMPVTDEGAVRYVGKIRAAVKRMQDLITALLNYARIGTRGKPLAPVDCNLIVADCLENLRATIVKRNAQITCGKLPTVLGDPSQLGQVFENLIANAIKFSPEEPKIEISANKKKNGFYEFHVKDHGLGISPQFHERIFLIFQRLHTASAYEGTGIGLSICQRIVERHGGTMRVESTGAQGSTFNFTLQSAKT